MPETLFLHIESRGKSMPRVMEPARDSLRVGRGASCEVRLEEPSLAEVECLLRRRNEVWHVQPLGPSGRISIDGRPVDHLRALAPGVPLRVGEYILTLRPTRAVQPAIRPFEVPLPAGPSPAMFAAGPSVVAEPLDEHRYPDPTHAASRRPPHASTIETHAAHPKTDLREKWLKAKRDERDWETRWRAAGQKLRDRSQRDDSRIADARATRPTITHPSPMIVPFPGRSDGVAEPREVPTGSANDSRPLADPVTPIDPAFVATDSVVACPPCSAEGVISAMTEPMAAGPGAVVETTASVPAPDVEAAPPESGDPSPVEPSVLRDSRREPPAEPPPPRRPKPTRRPTGGERRDPPKVGPVLPEIDDLEWPSARVILAAHQTARNRPKQPSEPIRRRPVRVPVPTEAVEPSHWSPPFWLGWFASAAAVFVLATVGLYLSWAWGQDAREAGLIADRLLGPHATGAEVFADSEVNPDAAWWRTTGSHLGMKAAALAGRRDDAAREETIAYFLDAARKAAPLEPSSRLVRAQREDGGRDGSISLASLGLSRDTASLTLTARRLARAGKKEAALLAYRVALEMTVKADITRGRAPTFLDGQDAKRFALPYEDMVAEVVREMAEQPEWTFAQWSPALPDHGLVLLATYRVLRGRESPEAEGALDRLIAAEHPPANGSAVLHRAARAEGLSLKGQLSEAAILYREAIDEMPEESVRRTWYLNLGEVLARAGETVKATDALMAARAGRGDDEIGARVAQAMERQGLGDRTAVADTKTRTFDLKSN